MCYQIFLSTNFDKDISEKNSDLVQFTEDLPFKINTEILNYKNIWYVESEAGGCSCSFRHADDLRLGFGEPEDWYPEDEIDIKATIDFIQIIRSILKAGFNVDCVDLWNDGSNSTNSPKKKLIDLSKMKNEEFRFFENYIFEFTLNER